MVEAALRRGHRVTTFHRGRSAPAGLPGAESLHGDRAGDLGALRGRRWDAVVDTSGYVPRLVRRSAELLSGQVGVYAFISSGSVYPLQSPDRDEGRGPVIQLADPASEDIERDYGGLKALCEEVVREVFAERGLSLRSGLLAGPFDPTERFTYWVRRMPRGGEVLGPGDPRRPVQLIDARDGAEWILDLLEAGRGGTFNMTGPAAPVDMGAVLEACGGGRITWVEDGWLAAQGVAPYSEVPLWVPPAMGSLLMPIDRALAAGLRHRPLGETVVATRNWAGGRAKAPGEVEAGGRVRRPGGLEGAREADLLRRWHERNG